MILVAVLIIGGTYFLIRAWTRSIKSWNSAYPNRVETTRSQFLARLSFHSIRASLPILFGASWIIIDAYLLIGWKIFSDHSIPMGLKALVFVSYALILGSLVITTLIVSLNIPQVLVPPSLRHEDGMLRIRSN